MHTLYVLEKVTKGLRVIRKKGNKDQAIKAGAIGTIVDVDKEGNIKVQWDKNVHESPEIFGTDKYNQYELLLFDNAQAGMYSCIRINI